MTKAHSLKTLVVLFSCLLLASGAFAAEMVGFGDGASWNLDKADFGGILTVSGPDGYSVQKAFGAGEAPSFSIWNKAGYALADGQYTWQISLNAAKLERGDAAGEKAAIHSGTFRIESGSLLVPKASGLGDSDGFAKDQVIADDLIVQGSACVGVDCSNGENFGFDTIRLKENNLRIKFQDTSSSASFPTNDWQLTANDSSNGGANKFSIDDIDNSRTPFTIEASAPSHSLYVDDGGQVGFGTSTPVVNLHVKEGNTPTLRLEQDGSSGFTPQTWDLAGNEANFFIRDATNGSALPFRIKPGAGNNAIFIDENGDVGMGVGDSGPDADLEVRRSTAFVFYRLTASGGSGTAKSADVTYNSNDEELRFNIADADGQELTIAADGNVTVAGLAGTGNRTVCVDSTGKLFTVASGANC